MVQLGHENLQNVLLKPKQLEVCYGDYTKPFALVTEAYSEPCQVSKMEFFAKIVNG